MQRPRRRATDQGTPEEWAWLTGVPDLNPFMGFFSLDHLRELWKEHEPTIRQLWAANPPAELPYGHPAAEAAA